MTHTDSDAIRRAVLVIGARSGIGAGFVLQPRFAGQALGADAGLGIGR